MNLFVVGWSAAAPVAAAEAERALDRLLERLPFLPGARRTSWTAPSGRAVAASAAHPPAQAGGARYVHADERELALFAGRPIAWTGDLEADGRGPLDARFYLERPPERWAEALDGRCTVVTCTESEGDPVLHAYADPMGAYPLFRAELGGTVWLSNNAELLREVAGRRRWRTDVLASVLGGGWSLSGDPVWEDVRRVGRGTLARLGPEGTTERELLPLGGFVPGIGEGFDARRAADLIVAGLRALAGWPGRPDQVAVTGGRDSRVVFGAALAAGLEFEAVTGGAPDDADVAVGRRLTELGGRPHALMPADPHGHLFSSWRRASELLLVSSGGTATLADALGFPLGPRDGPLPVLHGGQGGEIARAYYGHAPGDDRDALVERMLRQFLGRRPGRREPLNDDGVAAVRGELGGWVDEVLGAGARADDVPDLFYLLRRMGTWAGPTHGCVEWIRDTTSPLWSRRLLEHELGLPAAERRREAFHRRVLEQLAPQLVDVPFGDGGGWRTGRSELAMRTARARSLARKAAAEARRRLTARRGAAAAAAAAGASAPAPDDPFDGVLAGLREVVLSDRSHPAWEVLDRGAVESLLGRPAAALDPMSRYYAWRLGTVFGPSA